MVGTAQALARRQGTGELSLGRARCQGVVCTGGCRMTYPLDATGEGAPYSESLRTVGTNPTSVFTPVGQVMAERTILVAEDDTNTRRALQHYLKRSGYEVREAASVDESLEAVFAQPADLVILDFDIGGGTADVLTSIRRRSSVPVIVCSGRSTERRPSGPAEPRCRRRTDEARLLRRTRSPNAGRPAPRPRDATTTLDHGDLVIDQGTRKVTVGDVEVVMTRRNSTSSPSSPPHRDGCSHVRISSSASGDPTDDGRAGPPSPSTSAASASRLRSTPRIRAGSPPSGASGTDSPRRPPDHSLRRAGGHGPVARRVHARLRMRSFSTGRTQGRRSRDVPGKLRGP